MWPFCISDLKSLGAKSFYGKFCSGAIDHCSIRRLQLLLAKGHCSKTNPKNSENSQNIEIFEYSIFVIFNFREIVFEHLKVCLLLGVSIHREIFFENVLPDHAGEWRVMTRPGSFSHWLSLSRSDWLRASF